MRIVGTLLVATVVSLVSLVACGGGAGTGATQPAQPEPATPVPAETPAEPPATTPTEPAPPAESATPPPAAASLWKNVQVLPKEWSKDQMGDYMKNVVSAGLGVKCDFCHNTDDFADDGNKHKGIAREMIKMVDATNQQYFAKAKPITCVTCHNGSEHPKK